MCEIDITEFVTYGETWEFSGSIATHGPDAGPNTWRASLEEAKRTPLLTTEEQLDAMRQWAKETGAWDCAERAAWPPDEINALFIQLVSGDMRDTGLDNVDLEDFDWEAYRAEAEQGQISGNIYRAGDGRIFYYLGN